LDVGSGSGWQTALLGYVVASRKDKVVSESQRGLAGHVVAVERIPELAEMARTNVGQYGFLKSGAVEIFSGDGANLEFLQKISKGKKFDRVIAAAAAEGIPESWKKVLKIGGRIVAPVGNSIVVVDKLSKDQFRAKEHFGFSFVPLVEG